jgi:NAD(P)-dependent dehydrogenase (short-subunit alcohol dehydrogenase family)
MDLQLSGKLALISGSTAGIGFAIASALAKECAAVVINGRTQQRVDAAIANIRKAAPQAKVEGIAADLGTAKGVGAVTSRFASVDILVNNLSIFDPKAFEDISDEEWLRFFEVNVLSGVRLSRHYLPQMKVRNWGRIVFISSESGVQIPAEMIHYGMTKTAELAVARGLAETTIGTNVTVNSILPGPTSSEGVSEFVARFAEKEGVSREQFEKEFFKTARPSSLLQRFTTPDEVAQMVAFVCSPLSSATNGAALRVDGGVIRAIGS